MCEYEFGNTYRLVNVDDFGGTSAKYPLLTRSRVTVPLLMLFQLRVDVSPSPPSLQRYTHLYGLIDVLFPSSLTKHGPFSTHDQFTLFTASTHSRTLE